MSSVRTVVGFFAIVAVTRAAKYMENDVRYYVNADEMFASDAPGTYVKYAWENMNGLSDDMEVDHVWTKIPKASNPNGNGVFASSQFWYHDGTGATVAGGYMGSQVMAAQATGDSDRLVFIFSCWDSDPKVTGSALRVGWTTPETCSRFGGEGVGSHCIVEVPAIEGRMYTFRLFFDWKNETGAAWTGVVTDVSVGTSWTVGTLFYPHAPNTTESNGGFGRLGTYSNEFLEYFLGGTCDADVSVGVGTRGPFFNNRTVEPSQAWPAYSSTSDCNRTEVTACIPSGFGCGRPNVFVQGGRGVRRNNSDETSLWANSATNRTLPANETKIPSTRSRDAVLCTTNGSHIEHSNRSSAKSGCRGILGDQCPYKCDPGYVAIGQHVCQNYVTSDGTVFLNRTWFGGRCQRLCTAVNDTCLYPLRWRDPSSEDQCMRQLCFSSRTQMMRNLTRSAYEVFKIARSDRSGLYSDNVDLLTGTVGKDAATGVTGLGLIAEVVADALQYAPRAVQQTKILRTLRTMNGETPGVAFPRSPQGFVVHFLDRETGEATDMESCMMCTGLMAAGVNFVRNYYASIDPSSHLSEQIVDLSDRLWRSIEFDKLLCDESKESDRGTGIPMIQSFNGSCSAIQYPQASDGFYQFNEEHYTVWFAYLKNTSDDALSTMWTRWQGRRNAPNHAYANNSLLSEWSGYLVQLPYYTTASFHNDATYRELFRTHWLADRTYYTRTTHQGARGRYGLGAGTTPAWCTGGSRYYADRINEGNSYCRMISPYVTIGYLPNDPNTILSDVVALLEDGDTVLTFTAEDNRTHHVLWRSSMIDYQWIQGYGVTMVDFSSELFGLSTLWLSPDFYGNYSIAPVVS